MQLGKMLQNDSMALSDIEVSYLKAQHVNWGHVTTEGLPKMWASPSELKNYEVQNGDLLVCEGGEVGRAAILGGLNESAIIQNALHRVRGTDSGDVRFFNYLLRNISDAGWFAILCNKATIAHLTQDKLGAIQIPVPPTNEQQQIATFLDWKTSQIDALIAKKQTLLQKLKEKRLAVITQAVTKGLNTDAPMRDSGSDWIGKVPSHWDVLKIKFVTELASGHTPSRTVEEYWIDCNIPWVSLNDSKMLREKDSISETHYQISELGLANSSARLLPAGVVVFSRDATVGLCAITEVPMAVSQHFVAYICGEKITGKYLLFVLKAMNQHLQSLQTGSTIVTIGMPEVRGLICPLPTTVEQAAIVDHIDSVTAKIDQMLANAEIAITRLTEYRSALITAATTGKIDVRNVAIPAHA
jgi:type I restriction enzyme S subunit